MQKSHQHYIPVKEIEAYHKSGKDVTLNFKSQDEREVNQQLEERLRKDKEEEGEGGMVGTVFNAKKQESNFNAFAGKGVSLSGPSQQESEISDMEAAIYAEYADDPELAMAMIQSMRQSAQESLNIPDEPDSSADPSTFVTLQLRMPDG
jgi:hypothetical protein